MKNIKNFNFSVELLVFMKSPVDFWVYIGLDFYPLLGKSSEREAWINKSTETPSQEKSKKRSFIQNFNIFLYL